LKEREELAAIIKGDSWKNASEPANEKGEKTRVRGF
jgi:hypothetical protein